MGLDESLAMEVAKFRILHFGTSFPKGTASARGVRNGFWADSCRPRAFIVLPDPAASSFMPYFKQSPSFPWQRADVTASRTRFQRLVKPGGLASQTMERKDFSGARTPAVGGHLSRDAFCTERERGSRPAKCLGIGCVLAGVTDPSQVPLSSRTLF